MALITSGHYNGQPLKVLGYFGGKFETDQGWRNPGGVGLYTEELLVYLQTPYAWDSLWRLWEPKFSKARSIWMLKKRKGSWVPAEFYEHWKAFYNNYYRWGSGDCLRLNLNFDGRGKHVFVIESLNMFSIKTGEWQMTIKDLETGEILESAYDKDRIKVEPGSPGSPYQLK